MKFSIEIHYSHHFLTIVGDAKSLKEIEISMKKKRMYACHSGKYFYILDFKKVLHIKWSIEN